MNMTRRGTMVLIGGAMAAATVRPALAAGTVVNVSLWDRGPGSMDAAMAASGHGPLLGLGMKHSGAAMPEAMMGVTATPDSVPAGEVTFEVVNDSKDTIHEMVVAPVPAGGQPLPYINDEERVDEEKAGHLGEVSELDAGQRGALRVTLKPGQYVLYCNIPGHYSAGMWTVITVTG